MLITKTNEKQTLHYTMQFSFISIQKRRQLDRSSTPSSAPQQNHLYLFGFFFFDRCLQMFCLSQINQGLTSRYHSLETSARPISSHIMKMQKSFWAILLSHPVAECPRSAEVEHLLMAGSTGQTGSTLLCVDEYFASLQKLLLLHDRP